MNYLKSLWSNMNPTKQVVTIILGIIIVFLGIGAACKGGLSFAQSRVTNNPSPTPALQQPPAGNDDGTKATLPSPTTSPTAQQPVLDTPTSTPTSTPTATLAVPTNTPTVTAIPPTSTSVPATTAPSISIADYGITCWAEDVNIVLPGTENLGLKTYLRSKQKSDGKLYSLESSVFKGLTDSTPGWIVFEGRPKESEGKDHTFVYAIDTLVLPDFVFQEGTFYFVKKSEKCPNEDALMAIIDRILFQKWESRKTENELAGLEGFTLTARVYDTGIDLVNFTIDTPYEQLTGYTLNGLNTCNDLTEPRRTDYFGEQNGEYKNFYFGGPSCRSMAIGDFKADAVFQTSGFMIRLYDGAMDNQMVKNDGTIASFMFPSSWDASKIKSWLVQNYPNISISDPEQVILGN